MKYDVFYGAILAFPTQLNQQLLSHYTLPIPMSPFQLSAKDVFNLHARNNAQEMK